MEPRFRDQKIGKGGRTGLVFDKTCRGEKPILTPIFGINPPQIAGYGIWIYASCRNNTPDQSLLKECSVQDSLDGSIPKA